LTKTNISRKRRGIDKT